MSFLARSTVFKLCLGAVILVAATWTCKDWLARLFLPIFHWQLAQLCDMGTFDRLQYIDKGHASVLEAVVRVRLPARESMGDIEINSSTLVGHIAQYPILALCLVGAWQGLSWRSRILGGAVALLACSLAVCADIPFVLAGSLDDFVQFNLQGRDHPGSALISWMEFLNGGGRLLLALLVGVAAANVAVRAQVTHPVAGRSHRNCS
jgi:hypothetical protein